MERRNRVEDMVVVVSMEHDHAFAAAGDKQDGAEPTVMACRRGRADGDGLPTGNQGR